MNRALALCALMSLGGCECFERAYRDYCADSGACVDGGAGFGNVRRIELSDVGGTPLAGQCTPARVDFRNALEEVGPAGQSGEVELGATTGVHLFDSPDCAAGSERTRYAFGAEASSIPFSYNADRFGPMQIGAQLAGLEAPLANFISSAEVRFNSTQFAIDTSSCTSMIGVMAWSPATGGPVQAAAGTSITLTSDELTFGSSCLQEGPANFALAGFQSTIMVRAKMRADAGMGTVTAMGDPTAGLMGSAAAAVYPDCLPAGIACDGGSGSCCSPTSCSSGMCQ